MHYIIGTQIRSNSLHPAPTSSSRLKSVGAVQLRKKVVSEHFLPGETYTLYYIKQIEDDKLQYTFLNNTTEEKFDMMFDSAKDADIYLSRVLGEKLPDYESFYDKNKG